MLNYELRITEISKYGCCIIYTKNLKIDKDIEDYTYWIKNKCITIEKIV